MPGSALLICMCVIAAIALLLCETTNRKWMKQFKDTSDSIEAERVRWERERHELMNRIQSPDLQTYTNSVIKVKNAEKPAEEVKPVEWAG